MTNNTSASTGSKYRTQTRAGLIAAVPDSIATITHPDYQYALSIYKSADLCNKAAAYIVPSGSNDGISATYMHLNSFDSNPEQTYKRNSLVVEADTCKSVESKSMLVPNTHMLAAIFSFFQLNYKNKCDSSIIFGNTMDFTINIYIPSFMY